MIRAIVADDEERVVKLILALVDWEKLGIQIAGTARNGIEALELVEKTRPDLIITDIRMPGYDGLELIKKVKDLVGDVEIIIISGYGQFEYAQKAIAYDVGEYLLKPISQKDLTASLEKMVRVIHEKKGRLSLKNQWELMMKSDRENLRTTFLTEALLYGNGMLQKYSIEEINKHFHFEFREGMFQVAVVYIDCEEDVFATDKGGIQNKIKGFLSDAIKGCVWEVEIITKTDASFIVLNFDKATQPIMISRFKEILQDLAQAKICFTGLDITVGLGMPVDSIKQLEDSFVNARQAGDERIIRGTGRVYTMGKLPDNKLMQSQALHHLYRKVAIAVNRQSKQELLTLLTQLEQQLAQSLQQGIEPLTNKSGVNQEGNREWLLPEDFACWAAKVSGYEIRNLTMEICNTYLLQMRQHNLTTEDVRTFIGRFSQEIDRCSSLKDIFVRLRNMLEISMEQAFSRRLNHISRPIHEARQFIEANYMHSLNLEIVGKAVGFNPSYLSTLFKKETGIGFIEYLSEVRMRKAKELLKDTDMRIIDICLMVGYNDIKYFTKSFLKHTGLKPNKYRKIYSQIT